MPRGNSVRTADDLFPQWRKQLLWRRAQRSSCGKHFGKSFTQVMDETKTRPYCYHCTLANFIPGIIHKGLMPSDNPHWGGDLGARSLGHVFAAKSPSQAIYYGAIKFRDILKNDDVAHVPVLLRFMRPDFFRTDTDDSFDVMSSTFVPPAQIDVHWQGKWVPIKSMRSTPWDEFTYYYDEGEGYRDWDGEVFYSIEDCEKDAIKFVNQGLTIESLTGPHVQNPSGTLAFSTLVSSMSSPHIDRAKLNALMGLSQLVIPMKSLKETEEEDGTNQAAAEKYFEIGHGEDSDPDEKNKIWIYLSGQVEEVEENEDDRINTHPIAWGYDLQAKNPKGRYDGCTGELTIAMPSTGLWAFRDPPRDLLKQLWDIYTPSTTWVFPTNGKPYELDIEAKLQEGMTSREAFLRYENPDAPGTVDEILDKGHVINPDGTLVVYHGTTRAKAEVIIKERILRSPSDTGDSYGVHVSTSKDVAESYGDGTLVKMKVSVRDLHVEDVFSNGRLDFRIETRHNAYRPKAVLGIVGEEQEESLRESILAEITLRTARDRTKSARSRPHAGVPTRAKKAVATGKSYFKSITGNFIMNLETVSVTTPGVDSWQQKIQLRNLPVELKKSRQEVPRLIDAVRNALNGDVAAWCACPYFQYYGMAYLLTQWGEKLGRPENRPPNVRNPHREGAFCKHLHAAAGLSAQWLAPEIVNYLRSNPGELSASSRQLLWAFERQRGTGPFRTQPGATQQATRQRRRTPPVPQAHTQRRTDRTPGVPAIPPARGGTAPGQGEAPETRESRRQKLDMLRSLSEAKASTLMGWIRGDGSWLGLPEGKTHYPIAKKALGFTDREMTDGLLPGEGKYAWVVRTYGWIRVTGTSERSGWNAIFLVPNLDVKSKLQDWFSHNQDCVMYSVITAEEERKQSYSSHMMSRDEFEEWLSEARREKLELLRSFSEATGHYPYGWLDEHDHYIPNGNKNHENAALDLLKARDQYPGGWPDEAAYKLGWIRIASGVFTAWELNTDTLDRVRRFLTDHECTPMDVGGHEGEYVIEGENSNNRLWFTPEDVPDLPSKLAFATESLDEGQQIFPFLAQYDISKSQQFMKWFGHSKVVDEEGRPLVVYHGTQSPKDFSQFDVQRGAYLGGEDDEESEVEDSGSGGDPTACMGSHFTTDPKVAGAFASGTQNWMRARYVKSGTAGPRIIPCYLSLQNPKDFGYEKNLQAYVQEGNPQGAGYALDNAMDRAIEHDGIDLEGEEADAWGEKYNNDPAFRREQNHWILTSTDVSEQDRVEIAGELGSLAVERLKKEGHDGVIYQNEVEGGRAYIAFEPTQIKSAIGNRGKFSPKNPRIREATMNLSRSLSYIRNTMCLVYGQHPTMRLCEHARPQDLPVIHEDACRLSRILDRQLHEYKTCLSVIEQVAPVDVGYEKPMRIEFVELMSTRDRVEEEIDRLVEAGMGNQAMTLGQDASLRRTQKKNAIRRAIQGRDRASASAALNALMQNGPEAEEFQKLEPYARKLFNAQFVSAQQGTAAPASPTAQPTAQAPAVQPGATQQAPKAAQPKPGTVLPYQQPVSGAENEMMPMYSALHTAVQMMLPYVKDQGKASLDQNLRDIEANRNNTPMLQKVAARLAPYFTKAAEHFAGISAKLKKMVDALAFAIQHPNYVAQAPAKATPTAAQKQGQLSTVAARARQSISRERGLAASLSLRDRARLLVASM